MPTIQGNTHTTGSIYYTVTGPVHCDVNNTESTVDKIINFFASIVSRLANIFGTSSIQWEAVSLSIEGSKCMRQQEKSCLATEPPRIYTFEDYEKNKGQEDQRIKISLKNDEFLEQIKFENFLIRAREASPKRIPENGSSAVPISVTHEEQTTGQANSKSTVSQKWRTHNDNFGM